MRAAAAAVAAVIAAGPAAAEETSPFHFQATVATQAHPAFDAPYSGKNSLRSGKESATSVVMDLLAIFHPWSGGEITIQPELSGGRGLSATLGVAAFPSGEVYRVGNPDPTLILAKAVLKQASLNDGQNETWAFTEIDRSVAAGALQSGSRWGREGDEVGVALVVSGLSGRHRAYLAGGGYGFLIGDGRLAYGSEVLAELYYRAKLDERISLGVNYQPVFDPGFNRDRGPVHIFTGRAHVAF